MCGGGRTVLGQSLVGRLTLPYIPSRSPSLYSHSCLSLVQLFVFHLLSTAFSNQVLHLLFHTLSNALIKSQKTESGNSLLSKFLNKQWKYSKSSVSTYLSFLKPCWVSVSIPNLFKNLTNLLAKLFEKSFRDRSKLR